MRFLCLFFAALSLPAQQPPGVAPVWDVRQALTSLSGQTKRLQPVLAEFRVADWVSQGAPETYRAQWKAAQSEIGYFLRTLDALSAQPDRLTIALEAFLRMQALESMLESLNEGVRRYQNPALGDVLQSVLTETAPGRDKLREYLVELTATREQEFRIADQEAQRCRGTLLRQQSKKAQDRK